MSLPACAERRCRFVLFIAQSLSLCVLCSGRSTTKQLNPHLNLVDGSLGLATTVPGMVGVEAGNVVDKDLVEVREATVEADEDARA